MAEVAEEALVAIAALTMVNCIVLALVVKLYTEILKIRELTRG